MKSKREKKIKKFKKVRIIPNIILMLLYVVFTISLIFAFGSLYLTITFTDHIYNGIDDAEDIVYLLQIANENNSGSVVIPTEKLKDYEFVFTDENNKAIGGTMDFYLDDMSELFSDDTDMFITPEDFIDDFDYEQIYIDKSYLEDIFNDDFRIFKILSKIHMDDIDSDEAFHYYMTSDMPVFDISTWIIKEAYIDGDVYKVYYRTNCGFSNKEIVMLLLIVVMSILLAGIPFILYMITFIMSVKAQRRSTRIIFYDTSTGQKNWLYFIDRSETLLKKNYKKKNTKYGMISLKMERFSNYSLCYGNKDAEALLENFGRIISEFVEKKECAARYAEAEFGLLLRFDDGNELVNRVSGLINTLKNIELDRNIEFSCGICVATENEIASTVFNNASIARKTINSGSISRIAWFNENLKNEQLWEKHVEECMESALANNEFQVYIQPKYNPSTKILGGGEALIRWVSPTDGFVVPIKFIPIFEKNGFITKIDDFMLKSVCELQARWAREGKKLVPISVNISRVHFAQKDLAEHILNIVNQTGAPKEFIELELTESAFFEDKDILINTVKKLRDYGFKVSMDDFGADYSSLNSLNDLQLDVIKLDAGFFRGKQENEERGSRIVSGVIKLAKSLDMHTVAEGVEYENQVVFLADEGCDLIQGYYFAKPMPVSDYEKLI